MRLLHIGNDGGFSLIERVGTNIPPYAILSHTWGADNDEVTYKDLMEGTGTDKIGYEKLTFCGKQALRDGLHHFWVDTCAIDKSSSAELTEAINSMFQWYRNSTKCYVYLTDVSSDDFAKKNGKFEKSRWFTRGWTLQELLAPKSVGFFSSERIKIGDKNSMVHELHHITGIPPDALHGSSLSRFSVDERMAWAARRNTKREEDGAYCLIGLFEVSMPLLYGEGRERAFIRLRKEIDESSNPRVPQSKAASTFWHVPFVRNQHFVGQEVYLDRLEKLLRAEKSPPAIAITGLGGVGKTQIAIELAHQMRKKHSDCSIFWLPVTSSETLQKGFADIAQLLKVYAVEKEEDGIKKAVQRHLSLESTGRWLLILDNVDDMDLWSSELSGYLPQSRHGCIVCTTRSRKIAVKIATSEVIEMSEMEAQTGLKLLSESLIRQDLLNAKQDAQELLRQLTFLPLAITQAAAYINENGITLSEYVSLLNEQEEEVIELLSEKFEDMGRYDSSMNPVATTWLLSFEQIRSQSSLAADYLSFMACMNSKGIPKTLLPPAESPKLEMEAIGLLTGYSFVTKRAADNTFDVHRLVHLATRNWLRGKGTLATWTVNALKILKEAMPKNRDEAESTRSSWRSYLPHASSALDADLGEFETIRGEVVWSFAHCLLSDGRYAEAESAYLEVSQLRQRVLGSEHPDTLESKERLAHTYLQRGRFKEAEKLGTDIVETAEKVLGAEHRDTLRMKHLLAEIYSDQHRWREAENLHMQVLESRKRLLGERHLEIAASMGSLAVIYYYQRQWKEAEELCAQVLEMRQNLLGTDHLDTLTSMNDLAAAAKPGSLTTAQERYTQVIQLMKRVLGEKHPETLNSQANLAVTYMDQERWEEAETLLEQTIGTCTTVLGDNHPTAIITKGQLISLYQRQGRYDEAKDLGLRTVETSAEVLGNEHEITLILMGVIALAYYEQGASKEAEELQVRVLDAERRVLGAEHPETMISMHNLARTWKDLGRDAEAISLMEECAEMKKESLGPENSHTLYAQAWVSQWRNEASGLVDAETHYTPAESSAWGRTKERLKLAKLYRSLVRRPRTKDRG